jgi:hypothetical protein
MHGSISKIPSNKSHQAAFRGGMDLIQALKGKNRNIKVKV